MANRTFNDVKINVTFTPATSDTDPSYVIVEGGNNHASNIASPQDLSKALGKISNWYSNWHSVVWTGDAATISGHTIASDVPSGALFTDEKVKQSLKSDNKNYPILFSYYETSNTTVTPNAQTINRVNTIYINPSTGTITATNFVGTVNGYTIGANVPSDAVFTDEKVTQNIKTDNKNYPLLLSYYESTSSTTTAAAANRASAIYANPSTGTITATNFVGTINGYTISGNVAKAVPSDAVFTDTTYTFAEGSVNGKFTVTPSNGSAQSIKVHGLDTAAYAKTTDFTAAKPDGTHDLVDSSTNLINTEYLPSYVDDVIEGYYNSGDGKFYKNRSGTDPNYTYSDEITGESGKIYLDIGVTPAEAYRWGGSAYASLKQPTISAVANIVQKSNGVITKSFTDGTAASDVTVYTHPTTAGNKHIPSGGSTGKILGYGGSSGTATWVDPPDVSVFTGAANASTAGTKGTVPAPAASTYDATKNRYYLRSDATWSDDPVIQEDILTLNVIAAT